MGRRMFRTFGYALEVLIGGLLVLFLLDNGLAWGMIFSILAGLFCFGVLLFAIGHGMATRHG